MYTQFKSEKTTRRPTKPARVTPRTPTTVKEGKQLKFIKNAVDLHLINNHWWNYTNLFDNEEKALIVRRGNPFKVTLTFDRKYDPSKDNLLLLFTTGNDPKENKSTVIRLKVEPKAAEAPSNECWSAHVVQDENSDCDNKVTIEVLSSARAIVNRYKMMVVTSLIGIEEGRSSEDYFGDVMVLFNAWCKEDTVYMENKEWRDEYVLNEDGFIWVGSSEKYRGRAWDFDQFEDICLKAAFYLLEKSDITPTGRSSPVHVTRKLSALINSCDFDTGVLEGRWKSPYPEGTTKPWSWTGSAAILKEFMDMGGKPVKYGQCWVFSGVFTTLLRALGIPARSVTNFKSAHDTDSSMTIDLYYDYSWDKMPSDDSVWNFHVWNDAWFRRNDLPGGKYDGWQALDATPQETSQGTYQCGPAPLKAIKNGEVFFNHDIGFIFSEVNGDRVTWWVQEDGSRSCVKVEESVIGKFIITKAVGSDEADIINEQYKYPEKSAEERQVVANVQNLREDTKEKYDIWQIENDVTVDVQPCSQMDYGKDLSFTLKLKNSSKEERTVDSKALFNVSNNKPMASFNDAILKVLPVKINLKPDEEWSNNITITWGEYGDQLTTEEYVVVYVRGQVKETCQQLMYKSEKFDTDVTDPELKTSKNDVDVGEEFVLKMAFKNPLPCAMNNCTFCINGRDITKDMMKINCGRVDANNAITQQVTLKAKKSGTKRLVVTFSADEFIGGRTSLRIPVY